MKANHCETSTHNNDTTPIRTQTHTPMADTPAHVLNGQWIALNIARKVRNLHTLSLNCLASLASDESFHVGKSTVAAVLKGNYHTSTEPAIRARLATCITAEFARIGISPSEVSDTSETSTEPISSVKPVTFIKSVKNMRTTLAKPRVRTHISRCDQAGYITYQKRTYYLGSEFAGRITTVTSLRDRKDKGIRATTVNASRTAYPVDPTDNQLGYKGSGK